MFLTVWPSFYEASLVVSSFFLSPFSRNVTAVHIWSDSLHIAQCHTDVSITFGCDVPPKVKYGSQFRFTDINESEHVL